MNENQPGWIMPLSKGQFVESRAASRAHSTPSPLSQEDLPEPEVDPVLLGPMTHSEKVYKTLAARGIANMTKRRSESVAVIIYETIIQKIQKRLRYFQQIIIKMKTKFKMVSSNSESSVKGQQPLLRDHTIPGNPREGTACPRPACVIAATYLKRFPEQRPLTAPHSF